MPDALVESAPVEAVAGAVESTGSVASHLHPLRSYDLQLHPLPTGREEVWRFTPLKRLRGALDPEPTDDRDGMLAATYEVAAPDVVGLSTLRPGQAPRGSVLVPADRAAAVASAGTEQALHLSVPAGTELEEPIRVVVTGTPDRRSNAHYVFQVGAHAKATLVLDHVGSGVHTGNLEVLVGEGADVTVVSIQAWADDAVHLGQHDASVGRDAHYRHVAATLGGSVVRLNSVARYAGPGGDATLLGLYFADAGQHLEHRLFVDHNAPNTRSDVDYRGALQGKGAHTVWVGDVLIRKVAEGIQTYESNRNLVLTDGCRADSVPNLEIETGEIVGAGHASTTGRFDDLQLFYLQSRGVPEDEARRLVVYGFFADIVRRIGVPKIEERLMAAVEEELASSVGLPAATPVGAHG
ncbi:MAG: Fe-S cluster assembly protein SufD [Nocardioidaceae bacterium]